MTDAIKLAIEALEIGLDCAQEVADRTHQELKGYKPHRHAAVDADVAKIEAALAALRAQPDHIVDANGMVDHSELVKDAARYRWMKKEVVRIPPGWALIGWDVAIDHAMEMENK